MMAGPARGRFGRAIILRAALPCLALICLSRTVAHAQTVTPDLFSPTRGSQILAPDSPLRRTAAETNDPLNDRRLRDADKEKSAPSRIGQIPRTACPPPAVRQVRDTTRSTASSRSRNTIRPR